jgi:hypothetical protein
MSHPMPRVGRGEPAYYALGGLDPYFEAVECDVTFTLADLVASLTQSTHQQPRTVTIPVDNGGAGLEVAVTSLAAVYVPSWETNGQALGYMNRPNWRFEGQALKKVLDPYSDVIRIVGYVNVDSEGELDVVVYIQRIA